MYEVVPCKNYSDFREVEIEGLYVSMDTKKTAPKLYCCC